MPQWFSFQALGVFAFLSATEDQVYSGDLSCQLSVGDEVLWTIKVWIAGHMLSIFPIIVLTPSYRIIFEVENSSFEC